MREDIPIPMKSLVPAIPTDDEDLRELGEDLQGSPGSPSGTLYEVVGEVAFVQDPPAAAESSQQGGGSGPGNSGKDPEKIRKGLTPPELDGRVPARQGPDLQGPDVGSHRLPELRAGLGLQIGPGLLSGTRLRIERQTGTRVRPMPFQPPPPFQLTTQCRSHFPLRPLEPPRLGNHGFPRADDTRSNQPENPPPLVRVSGRVPFPEHPVPGHRKRRRHATRRMRLLLLQT
jgi:hypothetical protein